MTVVIEKNLDAKMRDGTVLRADVYRPQAEGRYPVLVQRTPYNKEFWPFSYAQLDPVRAAQAGYVVVIQDVRARWASDGEGFFPYRDEFDDGHDTVEWAAQLPYSDGRVGLYGVSYMGGSAWSAAATQPPSLGALAPTTAPRDWFRLMWRGGALQWGILSAWSTISIGANELVRTKMGSEEFLEWFSGLIDAIDDFDVAARHLPITEFPPAHPEDPSFLPFFTEILKHPTDDDFNRSLLIGDRHDQVEVPALIIAGWSDVVLGEDLDHFVAMRERAATEEARTRTRLIVGPWGHAQFLNVVGELDFGMRSLGFLLDLREDLTALHMRWFDQRLKGIPTGIDDEAPVKLFVMGINRWRDEQAWPLARAVESPWYLAADGGFTPEAPVGDAEPDTFVYDPEDPCPTLGGNLLLHPKYVRGPVDQTPLLDRKDVLVYTSEPLTEDLEVTGPVKAVVLAATDAEDTDWVVKLCDVHPDGRTFNVCDGILRATYRGGSERRELVEPDALERYEIDLWSTSMVFREGHRLRVLITSSDFPRYDRNPNTGELGVEASSTRPARQRIFRDSQRATHLLLPVVPGD